MTGERNAPALLLDEMHHPAVAAQLRERGFDVVAVSDMPELRAASDEDLFRWAAERRRWIVTENTKDFRRLLNQTAEASEMQACVLFTSPRAFPCSRRNLGPLVEALHRRLDGTHQLTEGGESWLVP